jgi:hypothetical protein
VSERANAKFKCTLCGIIPLEWTVIFFRQIFADVTRRAGSDMKTFNNSLQSNSWLQSNIPSRKILTTMQFFGNCALFSDTETVNESEYAKI